MIQSIGTDIIDTRRVGRLLKLYEARFAARIFTAQELAHAQYIKTEVRRVEAYARWFAAKEAAAKALGTGIRGGVSFLDFSVIRDEQGKPDLLCSGKALNVLNDAYGAGRWRFHLSLSDEPPYALAFVILEII